MHAHDSALTVHKPIRVGLIRNPLDGGVLISKDDNWSSLLVGLRLTRMLEVVVCQNVKSKLMHRTRSFHQF